MQTKIQINFNKGVTKEQIEKVSDTLNDFINQLFFDNADIIENYSATTNRDK